MVEISAFLDGEEVFSRELGPGEYSMGRLPENDLVLPHHEVSRRHARLLVGEQGQVSLEDLGSTNGLLLDGAPVTGSAWQPGQTLVVKPYELRLRRSSETAEVGSATVVLSADPQASATVVMEAPMPRLLVRSGQAPATEYSLPPGVSIIGRSEECQIRLAEASVSRRHAQVEVNAQGIFLRDLGSTGGTQVNGQRVNEALLSPGDRVAIGPVVLELAGPEGAASAAPRATPPKGKTGPPADTRPSGKKYFVLFVIGGVVIAGAMAFMAFLDGEEKAKKPEPVASQLVQDQQRQEEEERRRLVIISLTKAREAYQQGNLQAAMPLLNTVLAADPNQAEAREMLQQSQAAMASAEAARQQALQQAQARAQRVAGLGQQIQAAFREGRHAQVLEMARELHALDPNNPVARDLGAKSQAAMAQEETKRRESQAAVEKREAEAKRLYNEGAQQMQAGNLVAAVRAWNRVLEVDPKGDTQWPAKARGHLEQARPKLKAKGDERYAAGQAKLKAGDAAGAMASFQEALAADPWHGPAKAALDELQAKHARRVEELMQEADVLISLGDVKGALAKWRQALGLVAPGSARHNTIKANINKHAQ